MNTKTRTPVAQAAAGIASAPEAAEGVLVHAYRRSPWMTDDGTGKLTEKDVEVVCHGEKVRFRSNEAGHIVGLVRTPAALNRLVKEIPEAYIVYQGGENVPEAKKDTGPVRPEGAFILESNTTEGVKYAVLDEMDDDALRAFAKEAGIEDEQVPEVLKGDNLRRAIYNLLGGK